MRKSEELGGWNVLTKVGNVLIAENLDGEFLMVWWEVKIELGMGGLIDYFFKKLGWKEKDWW